jgi:hypothetical protein
MTVGGSIKASTGRLRAQRKFFNHIKLICPVQPFLQKHFGFPIDANQFFITAIPSRMRGVSRSSRTLGTGCGGRGGILRAT